MRGRIDTRAGLLAGLLESGNRSGLGPRAGEIDIMEYYRGTLLANAAWSVQGRRGPQWSTSKTLITDFNKPKWSSRFHYGAWTGSQLPSSSTWTRRAPHTVELDKTAADATGWSPSRQPHYLLLESGPLGEPPEATLPNPSFPAPTRG